MNINGTKHWTNAEYDLTNYYYKERMLHLQLNPDDTFELRWIDYYSESGFNKLTMENLLKGQEEGHKLTEFEKDALIEKNMADIVKGMLISLYRKSNKR